MSQNSSPSFIGSLTAVVSNMVKKVFGTPAISQSYGKLPEVPPVILPMTKAPDRPIGQQSFSATKEASSTGAPTVAVDPNQTKQFS